MLLSLSIPINKEAKFQPLFGLEYLRWSQNGLPFHHFNSSARQIFLYLLCEYWLFRAEHQRGNEILSLTFQYS